MNKQIETKKIPASDGKALIAKVKEIKNFGGEWKLQEMYSSVSYETLNDKINRWGIIISNGQEKFDIYSTNVKCDGTDRKGSLMNLVDLRHTEKDLQQFFPEVKNYFVTNENYFWKRVKENGEEYDLRRYLIAQNDLELQRIIGKYYLANRDEIQKSPDFDQWIKVESYEDSFHIYLGNKHNDNNGNSGEIKVAIKKNNFHAADYRPECPEKGWDMKGWWYMFLIDSNPQVIERNINRDSAVTFFKGGKSNPVSTSRKAKILRNLDKICLDPLGDLANAELLKSAEADKYYNVKNGIKISVAQKWIDKAHHVEIEGEEIDLDQNFYLGSEGYQEIKKSLINQIKQTASEWKIVEGTDKLMGSNNWIVQHSSGRRNWKIGINYFYPNRLEREKYWDQIAALINGSPLPVKKPTNNWGENEIKEYFQKNKIYSITLSNDNLIIKYNDGEENTLIANENDELQIIKTRVAREKNKQLTFSELQSPVNQSNPSNYPFVLGLIFGISGVIVVGTIVYFFRQKRQRK